MAGTQIGTVYQVGVGTTLTTYTVSQITTGADDVASADVNNEDGALSSRLIKQVHDRIELELIGQTSCDPDTDFPKGSISAATGYTDYYVDDMSYVRTEDHARVSVSLVNIGVTTIT
jgi:hypothetical protein